MIFDSHAHYDDSAFDEDRESLLSTLPDKGICTVINAGTNLESSDRSLSLSKSYPYIYAAVGVHPQEVDTFRENQIYDLEVLARSNKAVAIGEIGLDYHCGNENKDRQIELFCKQIELAKSLRLPVVVHARDALEDTLKVLKKYRPKGVVHCFSGSLEIAQEVLKLGMYIGVGGVITFKNSNKLVEVVKNISLGQILLETDAPYLAPEPLRGSRCDSSCIKFTAQRVAEIKNIMSEDVLEITANNASNLFDLSGEQK